MRMMWIAAIAVIAIPVTHAMAREGKANEIDNTPQGSFNQSAALADAMAKPPQTGGVQVQRQVDGVPGQTYGYGAVVSPSGDTVTYTNVIPPN